jgi:menaquinone-dependent protoporphyrinogen oxidase
MTVSVLVVFATKNGSTQQVADAIAGTIRSAGASVDCLPARSVRSTVDAFDLVVLGAPLYSGRWHHDAHRFLKRHRHDLPAVAVFAMGPRSGDAEAWSRSRTQLDRALAKDSWLTPTSIRLFGGVDPPRTSTHRDLRDWAAVSDWAGSLAGTASSRQPPAAGPDATATGVA